MKYFIKTYGCQMNYSDSERIAGIFEMAGYKKALLENDADLIIINACSVRQSAINKISGRFKKYKKFRKINPNLKIILTGCFLESDKKKFEKIFDLIIRIGEIEQHIISPLPKGSRGISSDYFQIKPLRQNKLSAYVPIMTGCNNFCSYCVVPYTRGREHSRPVEEIISEVDNLVKQRYKEIILLGQNVNSYESKVSINLSSRAKLWSFSDKKRSRGICQQIKCVSQLFLPKDKHSVLTDSPTCSYRRSVGMTNAINFPKLLKLINAIPGDFWIRFLTSHPKDMSEELIRTVAECGKVTPHIHLALQSGNDEILKKMNRKYTAKYFLELVKMIRKYLPAAAISTDIIIGFPGETEKQFQNTIKMMKKTKFDMAYLNKYSPRAGTAAAKLNDNISWAEKKRREKILTEVLRKTALENNKKYIGKIVEVLVDESGIKNQESGIISGKTKSFKNVRMDMKSTNKSLVRKFLNTKITQANSWGLEGEVVK